MYTHALLSEVLLLSFPLETCEVSMELTHLPWKLQATTAVSWQPNKSQSVFWWSAVFTTNFTQKPLTNRSRNTRSGLCDWGLHAPLQATLQPTCVLSLMPSVFCTLIVTMSYIRNHLTIFTRKNLILRFSKKTAYKWRIIINSYSSAGFLKHTL